MKQLQKIVLVVVMLFFTTSQAYVSANGATESLPKQMYQSLIVSTMAVAGVATAGHQWMIEQQDEIVATAGETWDLMSADMQANFMTSLNQAADGVTVASEYINSFLDRFASGPSVAPAVPPGVVSNGYYVAPPGDVINYNMGGRNYKISTISLYTITGYFMYMSYTNDYYASLLINGEHTGHGVYSDEPRKISDVTTAELFAMMTANPEHSLSINDVQFGVGAVNNTYSQADQWLRNREEGNTYSLGLSVPQPVPLTLDGTQLNRHPLTGQLTLDGVPYAGDVTWAPPVLGVREVGGVVTPTYTDAAGNVVALDGTVVVPADVPVIGDITDIAPVTPAPTGFGATTTALDFSPLIVASNTLTTKFPFSLPWDIMRQLSVFDVTPKTPEFEIDIQQYLKIENVSIPMKFTLDFAMFDTLASVIRWFNVILCDIGLILILRKLLPE